MDQRKWDEIEGGETGIPRKQSLETRIYVMQRLL
jgi:hypothetical protein